MAKLTDKQEMFCREYLIDLNATQAAIRSGYSAKTAQQMGSENLSKPVIQERIAILVNERNRRTEINADYVLNQAVKLHERCLQAEPVMMLIDGEMQEAGEYKFDGTNAARALEIIGKHTQVRAFEKDSEINVGVTVINPFKKANDSSSNDN